MAEEADTPRARPSAWYALAVLALVSFFAFLDRQILVLLAEPIRQDLGLSDLQLGMVQGFGVALFAALAGYPLGWAADRFDRLKVLAACIVWWSLAVIGCAMANSFWALLISGAMVGAGEAGLAPVMYALIPLFFMGRQRQIANSIAAMASVGGGALAFSAAGAIISMVAVYHQSLPGWLKGLEEWRLSLLAATLLAPIMIVLVLSIRTPRNSGNAVSAVTAAASSATATKTYLWRHRNAYLRFYIGGAMGSFAFLALAVWSAVAAARVFAQEPADVGAAFGVAQIASAASGFLLSLVVVRVWGARLGPALPVRMMWIGTLLAAMVLLTLPLAASAAHLFIIYGVAGIFLTLAAMAFPTALQSISPPHLRGRVASIQFIASMLIASGAPPLVGLVSDALSDRPDSVLLALTLVAVPALLAGALLLRSCEGRTLLALLEDAGEPSAPELAPLSADAAAAAAC